MGRINMGRIKNLEPRKARTLTRENRRASLDGTARGGCPHIDSRTSTLQSGMGAEYRALAGEISAIFSSPHSSISTLECL
jgi:hypothetical protein